MYNLNFLGRANLQIARVTTDLPSKVCALFGLKPPLVVSAPLAHPRRIVLIHRVQVAEVHHVHTGLLLVAHHVAEPEKAHTNLQSRMNAKFSCHENGLLTDDSNDTSVSSQHPLQIGITQDKP